MRRCRGHARTPRRSENVARAASNDACPNGAPNAIRRSGPAANSGSQIAPSAVMAARARTAMYHSGICGSDASVPGAGW